MPVDMKCYTPEWRAFRKERLREAGNRCEECKTPDRSVRESVEGEPYMVYLSIAHRNQYETWKVDAETMVLCQRCHRRYDRQFKRKVGPNDLTPIGYAALYFDYRGRKTLVGMSRTVEQLRDMIAVLPSGADIEIQLVVILAVVGNGHYRKQTNGSLTLIAEYGSCVGLVALLSL